MLSFNSSFLCYNFVTTVQVLNECSEVENWLREKKQLQDSLPKHADPVLLLSDIRKKSETLDRYIPYLFSL